MGLFSSPAEGQDGKLRELVGVPICIDHFELRDVNTMYGPGTAIDLYVKVGDSMKMYSGFSAGILRQLKDSKPEEFPVWAKIEDKPFRGGKSTMILVPSSESEVAEQLALPSEDDIPF